MPRSLLHLVDAYYMHEDRYDEWKETFVAEREHLSPCQADEEYYKWPPLVSFCLFAPAPLGAG